MGTISSTTFNTRSGSGTIDITHASLTGGQTFEVSSIGEVEADFDLEDQSDDAQNVYFKLGEFGFKGFDRLSDGTSLFATLDALSATDIIDLTFNFTTNASRSITDNYVFTIEDLEYNRDKRETSIEGATQVTSGLKQTLDSFFANEVALADKETFSIAGTPDCIDAKTFLDTALPLFNSSATAQNSSTNFNINGKTATNTYIVVDDAQSANTDVDELLFEMAACEGAIVGSMMGYNFFAQRNYTTSNKKSISEDDVKEETLDIKVGIDSYAGIDVNFEGNSSNYLNWSSHSRNTTLAEAVDDAAGQDPGDETQIDVTDAGGIAAGDVILVDQELMYVESKSTNTLTVIRGYKSEPATHANGTNVQDVFNEDAEKTLSITFRNNVMAWATWDSTNSEYDDVGGGTDAVADDGRDSYADAYGASKARKIELTLLGIDTLKPYETLELDTSFPSLIQNQIFRPSSLTYNFNDDTIKVEAYRVG